MGRQLLEQRLSLPLAFVTVCLLLDARTIAASIEPSAVAIFQNIDQEDDPLPEGAIARLGKLPGEHDSTDAPLQHTAPLEDIRFSPDGQLIATCGLDMTIRIWNAQTGEHLQRLEGEASRPFAFSPDGRYLVYTAISGFRQEIRAWDLVEHQAVSSLPASVSHLAFRDSDGLLVRAFNGRIATCSVPSFSEPDLNPPGGLFKRILEISSDGQFVASTSPGVQQANEIEVYSTLTGELMQTLSLGTPAGSNSLQLAFSKDNRMLASAGDTNVISIWELATGAEMARLTGLRHDVRDVMFSPDGRFLVSAGTDGTARVWNLSTGREIVSNIKHDQQIKAFSFSPDGTRLATASNDRTALVWVFAPNDGVPPVTQLVTVERFEELWNDLASAEVGIAFQAQSELAAEMKSSLPLLEQCVAKILQPSQSARILELIAELDSNEYMVRERATEELIRFREIAVDELNAALQETRSAEVRHRISRILSTPEDLPRFSREETNRALRVIDLLARDASDESIALLRTIADGFPSRDVMNTAQDALKSGNRTYDEMSRSIR
ncbi:MAG: WD40 repeat domain-containing protein [Pirellulales bacterium]|nr:WD40 repeat domain-containing protein [Pirellulales bacterium]